MSTTAAPPRRLALTAGPHSGPPADRPVAAAEQRTRGTASAPTPALRGETTRRLGPPLASAPVGQVMCWLGVGPDGAAPLSVTVSALTHDAHIAVGTVDAFHAWCAYLKVNPATVRTFTHSLGTGAEATTTAHGWALHVRLFGAAAEELS